MPGFVDLQRVGHCGDGSLPRRGSPPHAARARRTGAGGEGTLALQVLLTRILSAALAYHFGFLAISLALLGVGVGALVVYVRPAWFEAPLEALLARWGLGLALLLLVVPWPRCARSPSGCRWRSCASAHRWRR